MQTTVRVNAAALATAARNALAFIPSQAKVPVAQVSRLTVAPSGLWFTGTDTYAAGRAECPILDFTGDPCVVLIDRPTLVLIDKIGLSDKKSSGELTVVPGEGVWYQPQAGSGDPFNGPDVSAGNAEAWEMFTAIDEMLAEPKQFRSAFQPQLLSRFGKVVADDSDRVADLCIDDPELPVLVKIGTLFEGLVMPVSREVHATNIGEEGLW